jgi:hypothetical protein
MKIHLQISIFKCDREWDQDANQDPLQYWQKQVTPEDLTSLLSSSPGTWCETIHVYANCE